ncbi:hypothetical protein ACFFX1_10510 [Dactylosporangium sucinum]|uniref:Sel1 repeat family protein n=1 Tax=Dactylosporangium sucinum TaxID=1424081 RepID=A0A917WQM7_9ACTN|nr:hypothetical protein [Dactylosporangium sucinum]GGM23489.1 hypothetical protein GCM10007977_025870 [Dactylosporangium sucinum]
MPIYQLILVTATGRVRHRLALVPDPAAVLLLSHNPGLGEQVAAGLRTLLHDRSRPPVLVLATLWPQYWDTLTTAPGPAARTCTARPGSCSAGATLHVPDAFTATDLQTLHNTSGGTTGVDPRLAFAANAPDGRVTQQLAGVPALIERYTQANSVARAVIDVAIDARRLGHPRDHDWNSVGEDWLEQALAYTAKPCRGVPGPLTRIRPRPGQPATGQPHYRLADYLEQTGRIDRRRHLPAQRILERRRQRPHRHRRPLRTRPPGRPPWPGMPAPSNWHRHTADQGDVRSLLYLARRQDAVGDAAGAEALLQQGADRGDIGALWALAERREKARDAAGAEALLQRAADRGHTYALRDLAWRRGSSCSGGGSSSTSSTCRSSR